MGSLSASGIPVVAKQPFSFRKRDNFITQEDNRDDSVSSIVTYKPDQNRAIGSGSIVREGGSVDYYEELVVGTYMMARSSDARIASDDASRVRVVDLDGNQTSAVVPSGLTPHTPQTGTVHAGGRVVRRGSHNDTLIDRVSNE